MRRTTQKKFRHLQSHAWKLKETFLRAKLRKAMRGDRASLRMQQKYGTAG
jgi:hypothetical protein